MPSSKTIWMKRWLTVVGLCLVCSTLVSAQSTGGRILGRVADTSGAVLTKVKVTLTHEATGTSASTTTNDSGDYSFPQVSVGVYRMEFDLAGFKKNLQRSVNVDLNQVVTVNSILQIGEARETVEVTSEAPLVDTTSTQLGAVMDAHQVSNLPLNSRDTYQLLQLQPGVQGVGGSDLFYGSNTAGAVSVNGGRGRSNNFNVNGGDSNDLFVNAPAVQPTPDSIAEFRVLSNTFDAEYGRNSGAVINVVTKSGTNGWHGSFYEFLRNQMFNSRGYFDPRRPDDKQNQFGGTFGGPIIKDRTFFYVDYEGQRESGAQSGTSCVPDPAVITAAEADIAARGETLNSVTQALLARHPWPTPNLSAGVSDTSGCTAANLSLSTLFKNRVDSMIAKVDHNFNSNNLLTGRYYFGDSDQSFPFAQLAGGLLPGFNTITPTRVQLVSLSYVKVMGTSLNEARLGWNRFVEGFFPQDHSFNPSSIGLDTGVTSPFDFGLPKISVGGFSVIGATNSVPRSRVDSNWHFIDNYGWKSGRHDFKVGYEFRRTTIQLIQDNTFRGRLSFGSIPDPNGGPDLLPPLEAFLEGMPSGGKETQGNSKRHSFENNHGFYFQDSFRWTPRLTVNYGMRWDYFGVVGEKSHLFYQLDPTSASDLSPTNQLYNKDYNNFAPRIGLAYDVNGKGRTVVRAGWGLFYDAFAQDIFLGHAPYNCAFCPGPAYTGTGPSPISSAGPTTPIVANVPIFSGFTGLSDYFGTDRNIRTPYTQNFNLNLQQQFGKAVVQVGYVGARGTKLFRFRDINQPTQAQITAYDTSAAQCIGGIVVLPNCPIAGFDGPDNTNFNVPRTAYPALFYVNREESSASSTYHSFQTSLRTNNWRGITSAVNFVWSHSVDNASDSEDFIPNAAQPNNSFAPNLERGNSNFDIRRRFSWNFGYQLPHIDGGMSMLKNGWGIDGVLNSQDGQPFQLNYNFEGDYSGSGEGFDRPDVVGPIRYGSGPTSVDLSSFQVPCTFGNLTASSSSGDSNCLAGTRHFGNMGRNSLRGPAFKELNFSIFKDTHLTERLVLQFRAEFFNIFNHPNFANPNLPNFITDPASNGLDSFGRGVGNLGLTATGDVGIGNPFLGGGGPRGTQFALKITF
jgi:hypothetical protein